MAGRFGATRSRSARRALALGVALLSCVVWPLSPAGVLEAGAQCDVIPGVKNSFRGALGSLDRPFAIPGDDGEILTVRLNRSPGGCEEGAAGFSLAPGDQVVTIVFQPPAGPRNAVVLSTDCAARAAQLTACEGLLGGGSATCVAVGGGGNPFGLQVLDADTLRFRFPDTDDRVGTPSDDRTLTGPAAIAVTSSASALPCDLGSVTTPRCADATGVLACVDEIYAQDGTCGTGTINLRPDFGHFTALPPANDYQALCTSAPASPCTGLASELRFTVDAAGNALVPMDYRGVLVVSNRIPIPRLLLGDTSFEAFEGTGNPVQLPGSSFLASYSTGGHRLPPVFEPIANPAAVGELSLFGSVDAPVGVMRIQQRGCVGGSVAEGTSCSADAQCGGGICQEVFDFSGRFADDVGPVVIPNTPLALTLTTENPVPLDGLIESESMFAFVVNEAIEGVHLNDDADATDPVLRLRDRSTGVILPIGFNSTDGRAVTRVRDGRFRFPAVVVENDIVAFLELEPLEGDCELFAGGSSVCDKNGNGSVFDPILRVYRVAADCGGGTPCAQELTASFPTPIAVDAASLVNGRSVAISGGLVYFRIPEWRQAPQVTERVSVASNGSEADLASGNPSLSSDGGIVAFHSDATNLVPGDTNAAQDVFVHDRRGDRLGAMGQTKRVSVHSDGSEGDGDSNSPHISPDGGVVGFRSKATNLVPGIDTNGTKSDTFVHDVVTGATERVSVASDGSQGNERSFGPSLSSDGGIVAFASLASNFFVGDTPLSIDVFVHDRATGQTELVGEGGSQPSLSADGRFVAFEATSIAVHDRDTGLTDLVSAPGGIAFGVSHDPSLAIGRRFEAVAFTSDATSFVPGDTNGERDVYVQDRVTGAVERVSVASDGSQANAPSHTPYTSPDGRFVGFVSEASNLVPGDMNAVRDTFVHDRVTGATERVSVASDGGDGNGSSSPTRFLSLSSDGRVAAFSSEATNLVPGEDDTNTKQDVFVRGPDPDAASDLDLTGDLDLDDTVLQVFDSSAPGAPMTLGAAEEVAVAAGSAAFLLPESASGVDENLDGDTEDAFVHLSVAGAAAGDLNKEAVAIAMSDVLIAALVPSGPGGETFVEVYDWTSPAPTWTPVGITEAARVGVAGSVIALRTVDGEIQLFDFDDPGLSQLIPTPQKAEEFVLGEKLVAFRTREASQGVDLNGDLDTADDVLQVYDLVSGQLFNTEQAVIPCPLEACDPRFPYRVSGDTVTFITAECEQGGVEFNGCPGGGTDLNGDGDASDLIKQVFNAREAAAQAAASSSASAASASQLSTAAGDCVTPVAGASVGICTDTGEACGTDANCPSGRCFLPPGSCIEDLGTECSCTDSDGCSGCAAGEFCSPLPAPADGEGVCKEAQGPCTSDADCTFPASCFNAAAEIQRLFSPVAAMGGGGAVALFTAGSCVENIGPMCTSDGDCASDSRCGTGGSCERRHSACLTDADCDKGFPCAANLVVAGAADSDGDGLADPFDNCPRAAPVACTWCPPSWNPDQADVDGDGVGNVCDLIFIPEPDLNLLLATGLAFLATVGRRRMKR